MLFTGQFGSTGFFFWNFQSMKYVDQQIDSANWDWILNKKWTVATERIRVRSNGPNGSISSNGPNVPITQSTQSVIDYHPPQIIFSISSLNLKVNLQVKFWFLWPKLLSYFNSVSVMALQISRIMMINSEI